MKTAVRPRSQEGEGRLTAVKTKTGVDPSSVTMPGCWFPKYLDQLGQCGGQLDPLRTITIANDEGTMGRNCL